MPIQTIATGLLVALILAVAFVFVAPAAEHTAQSLNAAATAIGGAA